LALAGSGFTWYQNQVLSVQSESKLSLGVTEIGGQVSRLGDSISRLQQDQSNVITRADLDSNMLRLKTQFDQNVNDIEQNQDDLNESIEKINTDLEKGVNQYLVDEVSQLLRLANNSVLFGKDTKSAENALNLADQQLKTLSDPRYALVRVQINAEIEQLRSVKLVDVTAVSASLNEMREQISGLPLFNEPDSNQLATQPLAVAEEVTWRSELKKIWSDVLSSVQIQRVDQPPKPLLAPEQRYFLDQNIQLSLASASLALLQGEQAVYEHNLTTAKTWLMDYFDQKDEGVASVLKSLSALIDQPVSVTMPNITGSYQALQEIDGGK
jgi:uroporphyrin-3 C-methyltransferase